MAKRKFGDPENLESYDDNMPVDEKPAEPTKPPENLESKKSETKPVAEEKKPPAQCVDLRVFVKVAGPKPDQMAGFVYHAKKNKLGPMSVNEWRAEHKKFMAQPVK